GGEPWNGVFEALRGLQLRGGGKRDLRPVRKYVPDVSPPPVRALPQSVLPRGLPDRSNLQARGRRHRPHRPGEMPRMDDVRHGVPLQEDLLQLAYREIRKVHLLFPARRSWPADGVL